MTDTLKLSYHTDPILHKPTTKVTDFNDDLITLAGKMIGSMKFNRGVGLSANQVGIDKSICIASLQDQTKDIILVNPVLIKKSKEREKLYEGCLSVPKVYPPMKRFVEVTVEFQTVTGDKQQITATGFDARILQHEIDHLNGKLVIDKFVEDLPYLRRPQ